MIGDAVSLIGRTVRYTEADVAQTERRVARGCRAPSTTSLALPSVAVLASRAVNATSYSMAWRTPSNRPTAVASGTGGSAPRSAGSAWKSKTREAICMPPMPSASEWCIITTIAAPPSARPSTRVAVHIGRAWSNSLISARRAISRTVSRVPGSGAMTRRRW